MKFHHLTGLRGIAMGAALVAAGPAMGQMSPVSMSGSMEGETFIESFICGPGDTDSASAQAPAGFGPWNTSLLVESSTCGPSVWMRSISTLSAALSPSEIRFDGSSGFVRTVFPSMTVASSSGRSGVGCTFRVRTSTPYVLSGTTESLGFPTFVILDGPDGEIFFLLTDHGPFSTSGDLAPGEYTLDAIAQFQFECNNSSPYMSGGSSFNVVLSMTPPACPCDWNTDGTVASADFFAFLDDFFGGDADFNFDGATSSQDFFDFLRCFFAPPGVCA